MTISSHISCFISSITPELESKNYSKLVQEYFEINGHLVEIRIEPAEFRQTCKEIYNLIDGSTLTVKDCNNANDLIKAAQSKWDPNDKELIRIGIFNSSLTEELNNEYDYSSPRP